MKHILILDKKDIHQKIIRIAYEILENNYDEDEIHLIGIKENGYLFAEKIYKYLKGITKIKVSLNAISLDKGSPADENLQFDFDPKSLRDKVVILVDDVGNTGRTLCYALKPFLSYLPKKIEVAVLVDRKHKSFPVTADYVGLSLSTTMKEHVTVQFTSKKEEAYLS